MNVSYQEEIDVIVVVWVVFVVHAEGSVDMADVMDVVELLEGLVGEHSWTGETLPQVGTWGENTRVVSLDCNEYILSSTKNCPTLCSKLCIGSFKPLKKKVFPFSSGVMASNSMPAHRSGKEASPPLFHSYNNKHHLCYCECSWSNVKMCVIKLALLWEIRVMILICLLNTHRLLLHLVPACG